MTDAPPPLRGSPENALRLFFAITAPDHVKERLLRVQGEVGNDWRLVKPNQLHLTMAFLGEVPPTDLERVKGAGERVGEKFYPFEVTLSETGAFPNIRDPRIWFVEARASQLPEIAALLQESLKAWCDPKPFHPHLTLARRRADHARFVLARIDRTWVVDHLELVQSILTARGPEYSVVSRFPFKTVIPAL